MDTEYDVFRCDECQGLGYCKKTRAKALAEEPLLQIVERPLNFAIVDILTDALPIRTNLKRGSNKLAPQMQYAHDAFHQQDYETAFLNYKAIVSDGYYNWEAYLGLSLCSFHIEEYDEAVKYAHQIQFGNVSGWECGLLDFELYCLWKRNHRNNDLDKNKVKEVGKKVAKAIMGKC